MMFPKKLGRIWYFLRIHDSFTPFATCTAIPFLNDFPWCHFSSAQGGDPGLGTKSKIQLIWNTLKHHTNLDIQHTWYTYHTQNIHFFKEFPCPSRLVSIHLGPVRFLQGIMSPFPSATHPLICEGTAPALSCIQKTQAETQEPHPQICCKIHPWWKDQMTMVNIHQIERQIYQQTSHKLRILGCFSPLLVPCFVSFRLKTMENAPAEKPPIFFQNSPNAIFPPSFHPRLRFTGKSSLVESWPTSKHGRKRNQLSGLRQFIGD